MYIMFQIGTYTIAIAAKAMNKPLYVVAESYKFVRLFPLNQHDLPNQFKVYLITYEYVWFHKQFISYKSVNENRYIFAKNSNIDNEKECFLLSYISLKVCFISIHTNVLCFV